MKNLAAITSAVESLRKIDMHMDMGTALVFLLIAQFPGCSLKELQRLTGIDRSATSRHGLILTARGDICRGRKGMGLAEQRPDGRDARIKRYFLTKKGADLAATLNVIISKKAA